MEHYETPTAVRHDAHVLADEARALVTATSQIADEKVTAARVRLEKALASAKETALRLEERARERAHQADALVRTHPYESVAVAFGLGALIGVLVSRRV
jgi:ElaB/YqjD/DUF883 family membrane-anchored ribosome-binding protein